MKSKMEYTAVIRTLGTAGEKYQQLLNSLQQQSIQPKDIIVYIAEGYPLPKETIGKERYVYVKKGMVAQRALRYDEVQTEYILFLDDDLYLPTNAVELLYDELKEYNGNVISPDVFPNSRRPLVPELLMLLSGRMRVRRGDEKWGYMVMRNAGYSYNKNPKGVLQSQTNAGPCFFCKKKDFLKIEFQEELWLDKQKYPLGEDQVMFYKMHKKGLRVLTSYDSGILHLDAGSSRISEEREKRIIFSDFRFKTIFWHRFIYSCEASFLLKIWDIMCIGYALSFALLISLIKGQFDVFKLKIDAISDGIAFIKSEEYLKLPTINKL